MILFYEAEREEKNTARSFHLLFHITNFFLLFNYQNKQNTHPPHPINLTDRPCYSSLYYLYFYTSWDFENFKILMLWLKTLSLYLFFGFWSLSYSYQLQQDDFLIQSFNPKPSGRTTEEWKGVPETIFPLQLFSLRVMDFSLLFEDICIKLSTQQ